MLPRLKSTCLATATLLCLAVPAALLPLSSSLLPAVAQTTQDREAEAESLYQQGRQLIRNRQYAIALETLQRSLTLYEQLGDLAGQGHVLYSMGDAYYYQAQYEQALKLYERSLEFRRATGDRRNEAVTLNDIGLIYSNLGQYSRALEFHQQSLAISKEIGDRRGEGQSLNNIGTIYDRLGQYARALKFYQQSLVILKEIGDRRGEGTTLNNIGLIYSHLGQYSRALEFYQQALAILKEIGDRATEGTTLNNIGLIYYSLGQYAKALEFYQRALAISKEIGDRAGEGTALNNIGLIYSRLGQYSRALEFYQQALAINKEIGDRATEGTTLNNIGLIYDGLGQYPRALEFYQQALAINKEIGDRAIEGITLSNIGSIYDSLGQYSRALEFYQQALAILKEIGDRATEGTTLNNIGGIYYSLGQYAKALEFYQRALAISKEIGDRSAEGSTLNNIGFIYDSLKQYSRALEFYQQALAISKEIGDRSAKGLSLNNIGFIYSRLGQQSRALEFYQQALAIRKEIGDRRGEGESLNNIGSTYNNLGQYAEALEFYQQALTIFKDIGNRSGEGTALNNIGYLLEAQKQPVLAIVFLKQSVSAYEVIRQDLRNLSQEQQETYTRTVAHTYRRLADILLKQDRVLEAQQILDLLKVQELQVYLRNVRSAPAELIVLRPEEDILKRYSELQKTAIQVGQELAELRRLNSKNALTPAQNQRLGQLVELETQINRQFNEFIDSEAIQQLTEQLSRTSQKQNLNLEDLNALRDNLQKLDAVLLYPLILGDRLELVITTPDAPPVRRTVNNLKREDLNRVIAEFRSALQNPRRDARASAQQLYQWLIKPIEADLQQAKTKTILYAPDGQLRYIPLAALHDGKDWLAQRYRVNNITARSVTDFTTPPQKQLRIFAAAFGLQPRTIQVGTNQFSFAGLPFTVKEVQALNQMIPGTKNLIAQDFSRAETVKQLGSFNVVHLATHGKFVVGQAADSFIALGNGDHIPLPEIKDLSLTNVDLIVLSACETGIGDQLGNGEEILGLGYQFQRAGARAVIASLWQVDDGGTQALMSAFYGALQKGMTKAQALQEAQRALITGDYTTVGGKRSDIEIVDSRTGQPVTVSSDTLQHPYYWAPFILIGNGL